MSKGSKIESIIQKRKLSKPIIQTGFRSTRLIIANSIKRLASITILAMLMGSIAILSLSCSSKSSGETAELNAKLYPTTTNKEFAIIIDSDGKQYVKKSNRGELSILAGTHQARIYMSNRSNPLEITLKTEEPATYFLSIREDLLARDTYLLSLAKSDMKYLPTSQWVITKFIEIEGNSIYVINEIDPHSNIYNREL